MNNEEQLKRETVNIDVSDMPTLQELERKYLNFVLSKTSGNKVEAAKILGISIKTVYNKLGTRKDVVKEADLITEQA